MSKIEVEYEELFSYGGVCSDISVTKVISNFAFNKNYTEYSLGIEGVICYDSISDCIEYYEHLKEKLLEFLIENNMEATKRNAPSYKSYPIEIHKQFNIEDAPIGYMVFIDEIKVDELYDTYYIMEGIINQLKTINI